MFEFSVKADRGHVTVLVYAPGELAHQICGPMVQALTQLKPPLGFALSDDFDAIRSEEIDEPSGAAMHGFKLLGKADGFSGTSKELQKVIQNGLEIERLHLPMDVEVNGELIKCDFWVFDIVDAPLALHIDFGEIEEEEARDWLVQYTGASGAISHGLKGVSAEDIAEAAGSFVGALRRHGLAGMMHSTLQIDARKGWKKFTGNIWELTGKSNESDLDVSKRGFIAAYAQGVMLAPGLDRSEIEGDKANGLVWKFKRVDDGAKNIAHVMGGSMSQLSTGK